MKAVEFTTELNGGAVLAIPDAVAARLPKKGKVRVIVLTEDQTDEVEWRQATYAQFLREDPPEDTIYDTLR